VASSGTAIAAVDPVALAPHSLRRIIVTASLGTLFEWCDFYLYGSLAVFFGGLFFPHGNDTAQSSRAEGQKPLIFAAPGGILLWH
jgi:hypothetical protein